MDIMRHKKFILPNITLKKRISFYIVHQVHTYTRCCEFESRWGRDVQHYV